MPVLKRGFSIYTCIKRVNAENDRYILHFVVQLLPRNHPVSIYARIKVANMENNPFTFIVQYVLCCFIQLSHIQGALHGKQEKVQTGSRS